VHRLRNNRTSCDVRSIWQGISSSWSLIIIQSIPLRTKIREIAGEKISFHLTRDVFDSVRFTCVFCHYHLRASNEEKRIYLHFNSKIIMLIKMLTSYWGLQLSCMLNIIVFQSNAILTYHNLLHLSTTAFVEIDQNLECTFAHI